MLVAMRWPLGVALMLTLGGFDPGSTRPPSAAEEAAHLPGTVADEATKETEKELAKQADEDKDLESIYRSVPGIGPVSARVLANELEDMSHFSNERKLFRQCYYRKLLRNIEI